MRYLCLLWTLILFTANKTSAQSLVADSIRMQYHIPELAYAVVTSDSLLTQQVLGFQRVGTHYRAQPGDCFRFGSNTKTITSLIAARLVQEHKLSWNTRFFDLFPELKKHSKKAYHKITLFQLVSFRVRFVSYTYTWPTPDTSLFTGPDPKQRYQFMQWVLKQKPVRNNKSVYFSNPSYVAAAMMLEKASGVSYEALIATLNQDLHVAFGIGSPNMKDSLQPWGHNAALEAESPQPNKKLNWLLAAGNIHGSIQDVAVYAQEHLKGLHGRSKFLDQSSFEFLHYGLPQFSVGWYWTKDSQNHRVSYHVGNPGTFLSYVYIHPDEDLAYIFLCNVQSPEAEQGIAKLYTMLQQRFRGL